MPRGKQEGIKPSAGAKYSRGRSSSQNGKMLRLEDITDEHQLWLLLEDALQLGVSVTVAPTSGRKSIVVAFWDGDERTPWYLDNSEDWQEMVQTIES